MGRRHQIRRPGQPDDHPVRGALHPDIEPLGRPGQRAVLAADDVPFALLDGGIRRPQLRQGRRGRAVRGVQGRHRSGRQVGTHGRGRVPPRCREAHLPQRLQRREPHVPQEILRPHERELQGRRRRGRFLHGGRDARRSGQGGTLLPGAAGAVRIHVLVQAQMGAAKRHRMLFRQGHPRRAAPLRTVPQRLYRSHETFEPRRGSHGLRPGTVRRKDEGGGRRAAHGAGRTLHLPGRRARVLGHQIQRRRICPHPDPVGQGGQRTGFGKPLGQDRHADADPGDLGRGTGRRRRFAAQPLPHVRPAAQHLPRAGAGQDGQTPGLQRRQHLAAIHRGLVPRAGRRTDARRAQLRPGGTDTDPYRPTGQGRRRLR